MVVVQEEEEEETDGQGKPFRRHLHMEGGLTMGGSSQQGWPGYGGLRKPAGKIGKN
jgi:hypothetical protein